MDPAAQPDWEMSELERQLLEAARSDRVPDALGARMADGLGIQAAGAAASSGTAAATSSGIAPALRGGAMSKPLGAPLFAKAGLWGVLTVALAAAVASWHGAQSAPRARGAVQPPRADRAAAAQDSAAALPAAAAATRTGDAVAHAAVLPGDADSASDGAAALPTVRPSVPPDDVALRAEIALLDRARRALRGGASARALRLLDQHGRRFAAGRLVPEAAALRIEALVQRGAYEQAGSMSQQFVTTYPTHPLRAHVASLAPARGARGQSR